MILLSLDTAANLCAAALHDTATGDELGREVADIGAGHAERLMGVVAAALDDAGVGYADLDAIAVSVGPGSFTGVRIGVAAARGLALGLRIPSLGVSTLEALAFEARTAFPGRPVLALIDARRDELYAAAFASDGSATMQPRILARAELAGLAAGTDLVLAGSGAALLQQDTGRAFDTGPRGATADIAAYAGVAIARGLEGERPKPLYLRGADARPQAGFALPRVS